MIVVGSPRKRGNSWALARQAAAGAAAAGAKAETFFLHGMNLQPCRACNGCRRKAAEGCVVADDMPALHARLRAADALLIASPVYWFTVSAQTKLFIDRWYAFGGDRAYKELAAKPFGIVLVYGDADAFSSGAVNALRMFQDAITYIGGEIAGMVYGSAWKAGEVRRNKDLMERAFELGKRLGGAAST
jgi:multimeric flavodoxin WrbA